MSDLFAMEGFDGVTTPSMLVGKWNTVANPQGVNLVKAGQGRRGGNAYGDENFRLLYTDFPGTSGDWASFGFAMKLLRTPADPGGATLNWPHIATAQVSSPSRGTNLFVHHDRYFGLIQRNGGTVIATFTAYTIPLDEWIYVEWAIRGKLQGNLNSVIKVDGIQIGSSSVNTRDGVSSDLGYTRVGFGDTTTAAVAKDVLIDDVYILHHDQDTQPDYLGDVAVPALFPSGNGSHSQWVNSSGNSTDNYQRLSHQGEDDQTYVTTSGNGLRDTYAFDDVPGGLEGNDVAGVQLSFRGVTFNAPPTREVEAISRLGAQEHVSSPFALPSAFARRRHLMAERPGGGLWNIDNVNDAVYGFRSV